MWTRSALLVVASLVSFSAVAQPMPPGRPPPMHGAVAVVPGVRVSVPPPALRVEVRPAAPSANHLWIDGHWAWRGGAHTWLGGHWALPPNPGYTWVPARWVPEGGQYVFYEGHWASSYVPQETVAYVPPPPPAQPMYVETAPPEPLVEVRPALPFAGAVWIPGYWNWHGRHHVWVGGHWSAPVPGSNWEGTRWDRDGDRYRHVPGRWRH